MFEPGIGVALVGQVEFWLDFLNLPGRLNTVSLFNSYIIATIKPTFSFTLAF